MMLDHETIRIQAARAQESAAYWSRMARGSHWPLAAIDNQQRAFVAYALARELYELSHD